MTVAEFAWLQIHWTQQAMGTHWGFVMGVTCYFASVVDVASLSVLVSLALPLCCYPVNLHLAMSFYLTGNHSDSGSNTSPVTMTGRGLSDRTIILRSVPGRLLVDTVAPDCSWAWCADNSRRVPCICSCNQNVMSRLQDQYAKHRMYYISFYCYHASSNRATGGNTARK